MHVYKADITKLSVESIANACNEHLVHGGGVAYAIAGAAGFSLEDEGQDFIQKHGPLKTTEVAVTTGGSLPCKKVLHAVGPRWSDYTDKGMCQQHLVDTVYNCLLKAESLGFTSIALPSISSGVVSTQFEFTHTHTHTPHAYGIRTRTRARTHTHIHTHSHTHTRAHARARTHTHTHTHTLFLSLSLCLSLTHTTHGARAHTHTHTHTCLLYTSPSPRDFG